MDETERWLAENDPDYADKTWNDTDGSADYERPGQETPHGGIVQLQSLVDGGEGRLVRVTLDRACEGCFELFTPLTPWARFCGDRCRSRMHKRKSRREKG